MGNRDILQQIVIQKTGIPQRVKETRETRETRIRLNQGVYRVNQSVIGVAETTAVISVILRGIKVSSNRETRGGPIEVQQLVYPNNRD